jgi:predicted dehydrogenase/aryl-alcohol dehydrogenase-like predicted oxidoreductase
MTLRWGLAATGNIARTFASALGSSKTSTLAAVASRTPARAEGFAADFSEAGATPVLALDYDALVEHPEVDAIYVATPHPQHADWVLRALRAGKHVLCEKPMGVNHPEVMAMLDAAADADRFLMEAFMYRCHPQTLKLKSLLDDGAIGTVRQIRASFGFKASPQPASRLFAPALAGGGIMDVGCYPVSAACLIMGADPVSVTGEGHIGDTGVDYWASATLTFADGQSAQLATGITLGLDNTLQIFGDDGRIHVANPWNAAGNWSFELVRSDQVAEVIAGKAEPLYQIEIDHVAGCIASGARQSPLMSHEESLRNARVLDDWRQAIGLQYPAERASQHRPPLATTFSRPGSLAKPGSIPHLEKPVSRLVMGCDNQPGMSHAAVMWDNFFSLGGNCFDTAYIYGGGRMETLLGHWHSSRNLREDIVIIGKGAHTPDDNPAAVSPQLDESLTRLQTDHVDVYFLHRDNLDVPVGEFVDAVNAEIEKGRVKTWGGSNWTLERVQAANAYAQKNGKQGMSAVSNQFSLAHMIKPLWPGVQSATAPEFRAYLAETGMALMPWSSQARGFFTPWAEEVMQRTGRENPVITGVQPTMAELAETWFSEENFERRSRAVRLAEERGVAAIQIALAYVINQPFPCFPLIGPRQISETRSSLAALDIELSPTECRWLDLAD